MHKKFNHEEIEKKWQQVWEKSGIYDVGERDASKEKEYVLVEWPYPSGNLHIGHWFAFAVVDIYARARRMQGKQVLFPIGFDAFGLPAENAAIKHGLDPKAWTESNIAYMREQLKSMGNAFSWDTSTSSTDPEYYAWTQWMFTQFFEKGIAYRGTGIVNWCPGCNTVIANEQVKPDNTCERSGDLIEKRKMPQWMLRITDYADRLIDDLAALDWPEHIKEAQRQWIGRNQGAELTFTLLTGDDLRVFTTRPDTLFGATYVVLAPEHELLSKLKDSIQNFNEVEAYAKAASQKDEAERTNAEKEKTGVKLEGVTAKNPATGEDIPVFVADYVLGGYGTGAIMAVPAHDERDFAFAEKFGLPVVQVISGETPLPFTEAGTLVNSGSFNGVGSEEAKEAIIKKVGGKLTNTYRLRDWSIGRQRYWGVPVPIVYDPEGKPHIIPKEHLPWHLPTDVDFKPTGEAPLAKSVELKERTERIFGKGWTPEVETMDTFLDSSWYFLRYFDKDNTESFSSLEKQKEWMPIDIYFGGAEHTTMHLLYSRFWQKALFDLGLVNISEPYKKRVNRGLVLGPDGNKMSKSKGNVVDPDTEVKRLGADTVKMYLAFMGPYGETTNYPWDMGGIAGLRRFLERVYGLREHISGAGNKETEKLLHKSIEKVSEDINAYKFNTAISQLMIFINHAEKNGLSEDDYLTFLRLLAPFAPHVTEELWHEAGKTDSIHASAWPVAERALTLDQEVNVSVQINGKMRGLVRVAIDSDERTVLEAAKAEPSLSAKITGEPTRVIYVKNKILNLIL
jgi:leucyl-tRNA synthetase